jgi:ribosomal protein S18 acetylase RimI-like enzyme
VESMLALVPLLDPGELVYLMGDPPAVVPGLICGDMFPCLRMAGPDRVEAEIHDREIVSLTCADAPAMVALTDLAFPGFFRPRTCEMGDYFGIFEGQTLIAMGGERLRIRGWREISAVCTRPGYTGKGYAAKIIARLLHEHARAGLDSFLHVSKSNTRAISLYHHLGFSLMQEVPLYPVSRDSDPA